MFSRIARPIGEAILTVTRARPLVPGGPYAAEGIGGGVRLRAKRRCARDREHPTCRDPPDDLPRLPLVHLDALGLAAAVAERLSSVVSSCGT